MLKEELILCLQRKVPALMSARKIGLLIIDSIAAPYRVDYWKDQLQGRTMRTIGRLLHKLCKNDDLCVICINHVKIIFNTLSYILLSYVCIDIYLIFRFPQL